MHSNNNNHNNHPSNNRFISSMILIIIVLNMDFIRSMNITFDEQRNLNQFQSKIDFQRKIKWNNVLRWRYNEIIIRKKNRTIYIPDSFGNGPRGFLADEHVTSEPLQRRMLRDEAEVAMIARMKGAEWDILKRVEIVVARSLIFLKETRKGKEKMERLNYRIDIKEIL